MNILIISLLLAFGDSLDELYKLPDFKLMALLFFLVLPFIKLFDPFNLIVYYRLPLFLFVLDNILVIAGNCFSALLFSLKGFLKILFHRVDLPFIWVFDQFDLFLMPLIQLLIILFDMNNLLYNFLLDYYLWGLLLFLCFIKNRV